MSQKLNCKSSFDQLKHIGKYISVNLLHKYTDYHCPLHTHIHSHPVTLTTGHWGVMVETLAIKVHHCSLSSATHTTAEILHSAHSLMLLFQYFLCLPPLRPPSTVPNCHSLYLSKWSIHGVSSTIYLYHHFIVRFFWLHWWHFSGNVSPLMWSPCSVWSSSEATDRAWHCN